MEGHFIFFSFSARKRNWLFRCFYFLGRKKKTCLRSASTLNYENMQGYKMQDWKYWHDSAEVENMGVESKEYLM